MQIWHKQGGTGEIEVDEGQARPCWVPHPSLSLPQCGRAASWDSAWICSSRPPVSLQSAAEPWPAVITAPPFSSGGFFISWRLLIPVVSYAGLHGHIKYNTSHGQECGFLEWKGKAVGLLFFLRKQLIFLAHVMGFNNFITVFKRKKPLIGAWAYSSNKCNAVLMTSTLLLGVNFKPAGGSLNVHKVLKINNSASFKVQRLLIVLWGKRRSWKLMKPVLLSLVDVCALL